MGVIGSAELTLVLGGAASGKSAFAEKLALASGLPPHYVATAQAWDGEMLDKISRHRERRGPQWATHEAPLDLAGTLARVSAPGRVVLVDCLTLWLSNVMLEPSAPGAACETLLAGLVRRAGPVICVSNEVGQGIVPETALGRRFREAQGHLNQRVAAQADRVIAVMAGLPLVLKGAAEA